MYICEARDQSVYKSLFLSLRVFVIASKRDLFFYLSFLSFNLDESDLKSRLSCLPIKQNKNMYIWNESWAFNDGLYRV